MLPRVVAINRLGSGNGSVKPRSLPAVVIFDFCCTSTYISISRATWQTVKKLPLIINVFNTC